ncbi:hypothetical protein ACH5RR_037354 [Cinchona calisaya]|uniref:Uncharacterized protein n=1 Tax=Cinchona calisaya TaxID=153742 RepID=A0ABD2Y9N1_9GENT
MDESQYHKNLSIEEINCLQGTTGIPMNGKESNNTKSWDKGETSKQLIVEPRNGGQIGAPMGEATGHKKEKASGKNGEPQERRIIDSGIARKDHKRKNGKIALVLGMSKRGMKFSSSIT